MRHRLVALFLVLLAPGVRAQRVQLEMRPRGGDTVHMRLDQTMDMSSARRGVATSHTMHTALSMFSRAIVERAVATGTVILAIADSVQVIADSNARALGDDARRQIEGRRLRLWLSPDGTVEVLDRPRTLPREVNDLVSVMPGSFPKEAVAVGDTWMRVMPVPPAARMGLPLGGAVRVSFRLDSVSSAGDVAYLSMHGNLRQDSESGDDTPAAIAGDLAGSMIMDRKRGWLSESRFLIQVHATVRPANSATSAPMSFTMKITQHMQVTDGPPRH
jgi:hypothetical protein